MSIIWFPVFPIDEVRIFLRWLQYILHHVVYNRQHVFINADETALASVRHCGRGMASRFRRSRGTLQTRPRDRTDRAFTNTTLFAMVCDSPGLQPLLPQIILARYSQNSRVPATLQAHYRSCGFPFEFWHGSQGRVTPPIFRKWATRVRQAVTSYNPSAWIVLILDCCSAHLDQLSVAHLRRLGILVVFVPASLTWLVQILDVDVFCCLKRELRQSEARARANAPAGRIEPGQWMKLATTVIRREIINRDWSSSFTRFGAGETCDGLSTPLKQLLDETPIRPALPSRAEFALLINRPADSDVTRFLHRSILGYALKVRGLPFPSPPPHAASYALPFSAPASVQVPRRRRYEAMEAREAVDVFTDVAGDEPTFLHAFQPARNFQIEAPVVGDV